MTSLTLQDALEIARGILNDALETLSCDLKQSLHESIDAVFSRVDAAAIGSLWVSTDAQDRLLRTEIEAIFSERNRILNGKRALGVENNTSSEHIPKRQHHLNKVADSILHLKAQRLQEYHQPVYIAPMSKASLKSSEKVLQPLMDRVCSFLDSSQDVMVLLGDSGSGKSTFSLHLEQQLWDNFESDNIIPLYINLAAIHEPEQDMISKHLRIHGFTKCEIQELKDHYRLILICDGYDERQQLCNIYNSNLLNRPRQWSAKMVISCRTQFLGPNYEHLFAPQPSDHYKTISPGTFQEAVIVPFSKYQVKEYVFQYAPPHSRPWTAENYLRMLSSIPDLMDLVTNPFLLTLALEALPGIIEGHQDLSTIRLSPVQLYDHFVKRWFSVNLQRLQSSALSTVDREALNYLLDVDFISKGITYSTALATAIFDMQDGVPVVKYAHANDRNSWRTEFFGPQPDARLLRESSPLTRTGTSYQFLHRSLQEYFFSLAIFDPRSRCDQDEFAPHPGSGPSTFQLHDPNNPLFKHHLATEPSVVHFLCERVKQNPGFREQLLSILHQPKTEPNMTTAASNAIRILVRAGVPFNSTDLQGARDPATEHHDSQFDSTQLQCASISPSSVVRNWSQAKDVISTPSDRTRPGESSTQEDERYKACPCAYSPDGKILAVALCTRGDIGLYETTTYKIIFKLKGHIFYVWAIAFSPDSTQLASGGFDRIIRLWDCNNGKMLLRLLGHAGAVSSIEIAPCGKRLFSASHDMTVRIWSLPDGESLSVLRGHTCPVASVKYSSRRGHLISSGKDGSIGLWNPDTGESLSGWSTPRKDVRCIAYSPDGEMIASGSFDGVVRLWDPQTGIASSTLEGHTDHVNCVVFSPCGEWIAAGSVDGTVRLWDTRTQDGNSRPCVPAVISGFSEGVDDISWRPDSSFLEIASGFNDGSIRVWRLVYDDEQFKAKLLWSSSKESCTLVASDTTDLSVTDQKLTKRDMDDDVLPAEGQGGYSAEELD
jgi:WD40 repeat protein